MRASKGSAKNIAEHVPKRVTVLDRAAEHGPGATLRKKLLLAAYHLASYGYKKYHHTVTFRQKNALAKNILHGSGSGEVPPAAASGLRVVVLRWLYVVRAVGL